LIERPIVLINKQIDQGLKDGQSQAQVSYLFPALQDLVVNINTALQRAGQALNMKSQPVDRSFEANQLVENYPIAALALDKNLNVVTMNVQCEELVGLRLGQVQHQNYTQLNDQALILNLKDMFEQCVSSGLQTATAQLEFSGRSYKIITQPILSNEGIAYFLVAFHDASGGF
jgi:hypothetical protein